MRKYFMELPNSEYITIQIAYDYIKKTYPYLTEGFRLNEKLIQNFKRFQIPVFCWWDFDSFLAWGDKGDIRVPFPDVDCIVLGEIK